MVKPNLKSITSADLFTVHFVPTVIVFLVIMILIGFSWRTAAQAVVTSQNEQVAVRSQFVQDNIAQRIDVYNNALRGGTGLFQSSESVNRNEWYRYVSSLQIDEQLPAAMGIGYSEFIKPTDLAAYEQRIKSEGFADFKVNPQKPERSIYSSITFIEPLNDRNRKVFGGDMYTEVNRREAMDEARDTGRPSMTDVSSILQVNETRQNGVTIFNPVYKQGATTDTLEARRANIQGYIYSPLRSDVLFGNIFGDSDENFNFQIYDGDQMTPETLLYERFPNDSGDPFIFVKEEKLTVDDQLWTIRYSVRPEIVPLAIRSRPRNSALAGTIFALLASGLVYLLLQRRSRQLAERENEKVENAKDNMLSLASHQLRTPATGVKQYLGMVLEGFVGDITKEQKELLGKANESNERQLRIINEFLYLAKADADRIIISPQEFDLNELTKQIVSDMQPDILEAGHTVRVKKVGKKHDSKPILVTADPHSARMIIENLVSNAIKYTPTGGKINVTVTRHRTSGSVSVEDDGVGIDKKDFEKLFMQFSRIPNELTRQESGSGIGLYLAKYLAELNGGGIVVESERHHGSIFTVIFPHKTVKNITE